MAKSKARSLGKTFFLIITIVICISYVAACLAPYCSPTNYIWSGFAALSFPYLIIVLLFVLIFWLFAKPKLALLPLLVLLMGYNQIRVFFAFNYQAKFTLEKDEKSIRIVNWNVQGFNGLSNNKNIKNLIRTDLASSILKLNPDIVCLQEFNHSYNKNSNANNIRLFTEALPFYFFSKDYSKSNGYTNGSIIFSKFKIINSEKIKYPKGESLIYVDVLRGKDTVRIYTTHLQSFKFKKHDYDDIDRITDQDEDALLASKNIFLKMKPAFKRRAIQANMVKEYLAQSPYATILTGDFNDVPNSYTYQTIKADMQDAFLVKDFGIGRSFISLAPTLRIDYILPDNNFLIQQFDMIDEGLSDHIMLVSDVLLKQKKNNITNAN